MTQQRKILVVDDDPAMRRILTRILEHAGYRVTVANDGQDALTKVGGECPHFLITDWDMPTLDGLKLCQALRCEELPHYVYVIMLTGSYQNQLVQGLDCGADDFITKPVNSQELLARLKAGGRIVDLESKLQQLARCDTLTGALNRRTFFAEFEKEWQRSVRSGESLSCMMIDIDFFKLINDAHGHQTGDMALKTVAGVLQDLCRTPDTICRYGGEEFCVLQPGADEEGSRHAAERCRQAIERLRLDELGSLQMSASFGVAQRSSLAVTPEQLVNLADQALLFSKRTGRNRVSASSTLAAGELAGAAV